MKFCMFKTMKHESAVVAMENRGLTTMVAREKEKGLFIVFNTEALEVT